MSLNKVNYVHGQTIISAQNMNDIQDEVIRLGEKEVVQSDWLEQDENSLAYVKNKPFGIAGQYQVLCTAEEVALSNNLIQVTSDNSYNDSQNNGSNIYYLYKITSGLFFDFYGIGLDQKIAFESKGFYATLYDMRDSGGFTVSFSGYFNIPNVTGTIQFAGDVYSAPSHGIITISESTDSTIQTGLYLCLTSEKKCVVCDRVLLNSSYIFLTPGALSTIDMPLSVNKALRILDGISPKTPLLPMLQSANESLNNLSSALDNKVDKVGNKVLSDVNFTKSYETQVKSISNLANRVSNLEYYHDSDSNTLEERMAKSASLIASNIAASPQGAVINLQTLMEEFEKLMLGQFSDKLFISEDEEVMAMKISDKLPTIENFQKGFSCVMAGFDYFQGVYTACPIAGIIIPSITLNPEFWTDMEGLSVDVMDGISLVMGMFIIAQENNSAGISSGLYLLGSFNEFCLGLQINGFDLSSSTAPVSRAQIEDILLFIEESMITFTINGVSHRAIKGMTWSEWLNSRYNDTELTIVRHWQAGEIIGVNSSRILKLYTYVRPDEVIQAEEYHLDYETSEPT